MFLRRLAATTMGIVASVSPALAQTSRVSNRVSDANQFGGDSTLLLILAVLLIGAAVALLAGNNSDTPSSP